MPAVTARRFSPALSLLLLLLSLDAGCRRNVVQSQLPPPAPPAPAPAAPKAEPPPAPPPSCAAATDKCSADEKTRVFIADSGVAYSPPLGWSYVVATDHSRATHPEGLALLGVALAASDAADDLIAGVDQLTKAMAVENVKFDRLKKRLKKAQQEVPGDNGAIDLWEIGAGNQGGKAPLAAGRKGTALLALAHVATERTMIVLGFVVEPDDQGQAAVIMKAVQSLAESK